MLNEYALIPDIFLASSYSVDEPALVQKSLDDLRAHLLHEVLVRDLYDGEWSNFCHSQLAKWHPRAKELITKLKTQNRLFPAEIANHGIPTHEKGWCMEALASSEMTPLDGIISGHTTKKEFPKNAKVASIEKLGTTLWWTSRKGSNRLKRSTEDFIKHLRRILKCANSLMFIDRNLNPSSRNYREFGEILLETAHRDPAPLIELHRVAYEDPKDKRPLEINYWETTFKPLHDILSDGGVSAEVFFWDDHHDRYLVTDLIGINMPWGFDTTTDTKQKTTWTRLDRDDRDDIQREFDPASNRHELHYSFPIGS